MVNAEKQKALRGTKQTHKHREGLSHVPGFQGKTGDGKITRKYSKVSKSDIFLQILTLTFKHISWIKKESALHILAFFF